MRNVRIDGIALIEKQEKKRWFIVSTVGRRFITVVVSGSTVAVNVTSKIDFVNKKSNYN